MQQTFSCPRCGSRNPPGHRFCGKCGAPIGHRVEDQTSQSAHLDTTSFRFWLELGNTKTTYEGYNCLWCINEAGEFITVIAPRDLVMSTTQRGAEFYQAIFPGAEVGLAFIQTIINDIDSSFLTPIAYTSPEETENIDLLFEAVVKSIKSKGNMDSVLKFIKRSKYHKDFWRELVNIKKLSVFSTPGCNAPRQSLSRAKNWRHVAPWESDYLTADGIPSFWYTYPGTEFKLDFWLKYKMDWRSLFHRSKDR
jgi:hypothetical protein